MRTSFSHILVVQGDFLLYTSTSDGFRMACRFIYFTTTIALRLSAAVFVSLKMLSPCHVLGDEDEDAHTTINSYHVPRLPPMRLSGVA